ncbi:MAG TPA: hypothetical protein VGF94_06965 [Kofleriaceae bacterium]|jgi:hypothetical protein
MTRVWFVLVAAAACGGPQIPQHNGYRPNAKPWKKAKVLKFDDKGDAKAEGDLSYAEYKRSAWYEADLQSPGDLVIKVDVNPPGDAVDDNFDLGIEALDPGDHMIQRKDLNEGDQQNEQQKSLALDRLAAGKYLIHLYLQDRRDTADFVLHASFKSGKAPDAQSDFPSQVAFLPPLPLVPIDDDTPKSYRPPPPTIITHTPHHGGTHMPPPKHEDKPAVKLTARIIGISAVSGGTQITLAKGTANGATTGMPGSINGVPGSSFTLAACNDHTCTAVVKVSPDALKSGPDVTIGQ